MSRHGAYDKIKKSLMLLSVIAFHSMLHIYPSLARSLGFFGAKVFSGGSLYPKYGAKQSPTHPVPHPRITTTSIATTNDLVLLPFPKP